MIESIALSRRAALISEQGWRGVIIQWFCISKQDNIMYCKTYQMNDFNSTKLKDQYYQDQLKHENKVVL